MGELSPWHWAIVILVLVLLFGAKRLPDAARCLGRSARILKSELRTDQENPPTTPTAEPTSVTPPATPPASATSPAPSTSELTDSTVTTPHTSPRQN
jgi:sec-independent protein translocase protein TatA